MKKIECLVMMVVLCVAVLLVFPQTGTANPFVDDTGCLMCHDGSFGGALHTTHGSFSCTICHVSVGDTPASSTCIACHPLGDSGKCPLVNLHDPALQADCLSCHVECAQADGFDFGDAPEGTLAYPSLGIFGAFPTCLTVGPLTWIQHTNFGAFFGPLVDFEPDGNGGLCPTFAPYDNDECFMDGDAGLLTPQAYTIDPTPAVVPCPIGQAPPALGLTCQTAVWGINVDIDVSNFMPNQTAGYVNVLMDWNQDGFWGGSSPCPPAGTPAPEHVLVNFLVPNGFSGPLSMLGPPAFLIGPNSGYVWTRFSITEFPVPLPWDGSGMYEDGESEDYLIRVDSEAPDSDGDGIPDPFDNCPNHPNPGQEDTYPPPSGNNCGDACECEGNFDDDQDQDGSDAANFKADFGRSPFSRPCTNGDPCNGDFDCDGDVDGTDAALFKSDFGRSPFFNPCPICPTDPWCSYP